jgi:hypothetical protein
LRLGIDAWKVEGIASMLNYFLFQLVGPAHKALRVKDQRNMNSSPRNCFFR